MAGRGSFMPVSVREIMMFHRWGSYQLHLISINAINSNHNTSMRTLPLACASFHCVSGRNSALASLHHPKIWLFVACWWTLLRRSRASLARWVDRRTTSEPGRHPCHLHCYACSQLFPACSCDGSYCNNRPYHSFLRSLLNRGQ